MMVFQRVGACRQTWLPSWFLAVACAALANPVPFVNQPLAPASVAPGGAAFTLTVAGTGFVSGSVVNWNGSPRATTFVSASQLTAAILASDIAMPGTASVTVVSPSPGGIESNVSYLPITVPTTSVSVNLSRINGGCSNLSLAGDFNGDGVADVALSQDCGGLEEFSIVLGNGNGTFGQPTNYFLGDRVYGGPLAVGDFNGDGKLDLAVGINGAINGVSIWLGNGDGTFQPGAVEVLQSPPSFVVAGDFNRDGKLDLALNANDSVYILLGNGDGTFHPAVGYGVGGSGFNMAVGDFSGDGNLDLATVNENGISVLLGNGDGTFRSAITYSAGDGPSAVIAADFNDDQKLDLAVTNFSASSDSVSILLGNGDGTFQTHVDFAAGFGPLSLVSGDFNGDGKIDLAVGDGATSGVGFLFGNGDGTFQPYVFYSGNDGGSLSTADFNGDGRLDVLFGSFLDLQIPVVTLTSTSLSYENQNVGSASPPQPVTVTNTGSVTFAISGISISGTDPGDFSQSDNCIGNLAPSASCNIGVTFAPTATGVRTASVAIADNAPGSPQAISLSGIGVAPAVTLSRSHLRFATQLVGTASGAVPLVVRNTGTAPLVISGIAATGDFSESGECGTIAVGAKCMIDVVFTPTTRGALTGMLAITDNATVNPQTVPLSGVGTFVNLSGNTLALGTERVGKKTRPATVTLTNEGGRDLGISRIGIGGTDASDFAATTTCPASLAPRKTCSISITFKPTATGARNATLSITDNGGGSPQEVALTGTGT